MHQGMCSELGWAVARAARLLQRRTERLAAGYALFILASVRQTQGLEGSCFV